MSRSQQFQDGYRRASKAAVEWLHKLANEMGDPHAKTVLDMAAFNLGVDMKRDTPAPPSRPDTVPVEGVGELIAMAESWAAECRPPLNDVFRKLATALRQLQGRVEELQKEVADLIEDVNHRGNSIMKMEQYIQELEGALKEIEDSVDASPVFSDEAMYHIRTWVRRALLPRQADEG